ncbi:CAAX protease self-immunity [Mesobacillus persicus]|uniref:CAAX protease self-immunity n=1 Tax=Mesobacillus persicus TaxID=930146 RepID=A0A1H8JYN7_9BACI|nr:type II CAAX endopeptidase family protein [Mesobacillus persicus]SEN85671.1 CAAX protease self-immunity [Mesobacillus persicus]
MAIIIFGSLLLIFLIFIYPFLDLKYTKPLKEKKDSQSRLFYYKFAIYSEWIVVAFILLFVLVSASTFRDIGLMLPNQNISENLGMIVGFLVGVLAVVFVLMKIPFYRKYQNSQIGEIDYMLPTTKLERKWSVLAAITAGVCEEIIYRGFVIEYLSKLPFDIPPAYIVLISAVIFGFAHIYQGWKGFLLTGIVGYAMARVYLSTGSLLFPILLHIIIDLRAFLFTKKIPEETDATVKI